MKTPVTEDWHEFNVQIHISTSLEVWSSLMESREERKIERDKNRVNNNDNNNSNNNNNNSRNLVSFNLEFVSTLNGWM